MCPICERNVFRLSHPRSKDVFQYTRVNFFSRNVYHEQSPGIGSIFSLNKNLLQIFLGKVELIGLIRLSETWGICKEWDKYCIEM